MSLYFVTGVSGSGKSELTLGLRKRGYTAYDTDDDALARWQHNTTGFIHPKSSVKSHQRTEEFLAQHQWNVPREFVEQLSLEARDKPVLICGVANNISQLRDLFEDVFALVIDEETMRTRLTNRTNNDWGKQPHEMEQSLATQREAADVYRSLGYIMIDASRPKDEVIDSILKTVDP